MRDGALFLPWLQFEIDAAVVMLAEFGVKLPTSRHGDSCATPSLRRAAAPSPWHRVGQIHAEFGEHHYGRVDLELKPGQKERAIAHFSNAKLKRVLEWPVARREDLDGIKLYLGEIGWVMLRASGTEPMLRIYSETTSPATTRKHSRRNLRHCEASLDPILFT